MKRFFKFAAIILLGLIALLVLLYAGGRYYFQHQSATAIEKTNARASTMIVGDVSRPLALTEFFDYRCPHCLAMAKIVNEAIEGDNDVKLILRPAAVLGDESLWIAAFVLATEQQGKGNAIRLHKTLMERDAPADYVAVKAVAGVLGIDVAQAEKDAKRPELQKEITDNTQALLDIGFNAVPALIIGETGYMPQHAMPGVNELRMMMMDAKSKHGARQAVK